MKLYSLPHSTLQAINTVYSNRIFKKHKKYIRKLQARAFESNYVLTSSHCSHISVLKIHGNKICYFARGLRCTCSACKQIVITDLLSRNFTLCMILTAKLIFYIRRVQSSIRQ
jgi:hypothetical protein